MKLTRKKIDIGRRKFIAGIRSKHNFHEIGDGVDARVFGNSHTDFVYKITNPEETEGYRCFITSAMRRQDNPWFPKIHSAIIYQPERGQDYLVVKMEKLIKMEWDDQLSLIAGSMHDPNAPELNDPALIPYRDTAHFKDLCGILRHLYRKYFNDLHYENIMRRISDNHPVITDPVRY